MGGLAACLAPLTSLCSVGADETIFLENEAISVEWLHQESFDDDDWQASWVVESQGPSVEAIDGQLQIRPVDDNRQEAGVTVWYRESLPADMVVRTVASTEATVENNACNLNFFSHAREADGSPLLFGRSGLYKDYHQIPNYIFTFTGGVTPGWARARLNPGFNLISDCQGVRSEPGNRYTFFIVISGPHIRYYLNGELIHDLAVQDPLPGGWFGLRSWFSSVNFESVEIGRLLEIESLQPVVQ